MKTIIVLAGVLSLGVAGPVLAANADHPYENCDKKVDNCAPTGNSTTDDLNKQQVGGPATAPFPSGQTRMHESAPRE